MGVNDRANERKAAKKTQTARGKAVQDGWKGFVNVELNDLQKAECKLWRAHPEKIWNVIWDLEAAGYKLTISCDDRNGTHNVSMTCREPKDINMGMTLTGRGGDVQSAVAAFAYKHSVILEGDWGIVGVAAPRITDEDYVG